MIHESAVIQKCLNYSLFDVQCWIVWNGFPLSFKTVLLAGFISEQCPGG